jgi:hypothetical protein
MREIRIGFRAQASKRKKMTIPISVATTIAFHRNPVASELGL